MNLFAAPFPAGWLIASAVLSCCVLSLALAWLRTRPPAPHLAGALAGATVCVLAAWLMSGGVREGLSFHLLGAALLTLMGGPAAALVSLALVIAAVSVAGQAGLLAFGPNFVAMACVPVAWVWVVFVLARRHLPANYFVYLFVVAFVGGGSSLLFASLATLAQLHLAGAYPADVLLEEGLPFYFLLSWSEAFMTGLMAAVLVVYRPQWVSTFDDAHYLRRED